MCPIYLQNNSGLKLVPNYYNNIAGWTTTVELTWLYWVAQEMESIVEIGSWRGRSTDALLSGCEGTVWAVDHFRGNEEHSEEQRKDIHKFFRENVGHYKNLKLLKMDSLEAVKRFKDKSIDMVFIDGGHEYEEVKADIEAWLPKTKKLMCGHDYFRKGVRRAIDELLGDVNVMSLIWIKPLKEAS